MTMLSGWANHIELTRSTRRHFVCNKLRQNASYIFATPNSKLKKTVKIVSKTFQLKARKFA